MACKMYIEYGDMSSIDHDDIYELFEVSTIRKELKFGVVCQKQVSRAGTSNYIPQILWNVITCSCP